MLGLWKQAETLKQTDPENAADIVAEKKLKCIFLPPIDDDDDSKKLKNNIKEKSPVLNSNTQKPEIQMIDVSNNQSSRSSIRENISPPTTNPRSSSPNTDKVLSTSQTSIPDSVSSTKQSPITPSSAIETIKKLTAACEEYKAEIDRLNRLRERRKSVDK
jgi:hypothetical protein